MNLGHHPSIHAARTPDKIACIEAKTGACVSYRELDERSNQTAQMFRAIGLQSGDHISIMCQNHSRFLELVWGAHRAGLYYTPISWHATADEVSYIVEDAGSKAIFISSRFAGIAETVRSEGSECIAQFSMFNDIPGYLSYESERSKHDVVPISDQTSGSDMLYTSGTTGKPKGVRFPLTGQPVDFADPNELMFRAAGYDEDCVAMTLGPMYHASSLYTSLVTHRFGGVCIIVDKFDAADTLHFIETYAVSQLNCVPTHFIRMLKLPAEERARFDVSSLNCVLHTAAPCPVDIKRAMIEWFGPVILEYYGGTEKVGGAMINSQEWLKHPGSIGKPVGGAVQVVDEATWKTLPPGEIGAIYFEHGAEFSYHNDVKKTQSVYSPEGWKTLGDIGYVDEDGYIYLTDRKSNMIISGGVNVYPQEAENRLVTHPKVQDAAVVGIPNRDFGEEVKAFIEPMDWEDTGPELEAELIKYCKEVLSSIKCPRSIDFERKLPRQDNGKLYKRLLKARYEARK